jgi:putative membrane protein
MTKYLLAAVILSFISCTKTRDDYDTGADEDFVLQASVANTIETELGIVAANNGIDEGVKAFAQNTSTYHKQAQTQLKSLAMTLNLAAADSMDEQHVLLRNQLLNLSGRAFDSVYIHTRVQDYQQATKLFFQEVITGESSQLKDYSASVLAQLEVYLHQADSLVAKY